MAKKILIRSAKTLLAVLVLLGILNIYSAFTSSPQVGFFRTAAGRNEYKAAYELAMAALPKPTKTHDLPTDFGVVRAYEWSTPETKNTIPIVLVPGRTSGTPMWSENLKYFVKNHRVIAFDALGDAGLSEQAVPMVEFNDLAVWMNQAIGALAPEGVHMVGHSFGGATAAAYAHEYPENVQSLTLLEPALTLGYPKAQLMAWVMLASIPGLPQSLREKALGRIGGGDYNSEDPVARMIESGAAHYSAALPTPRLLNEEQTAKMEMPVYVALASDNSLAGGKKVVEHTKELLPQAHVKVWDNTTHSLPMQVAEPLSIELEEFWATAEK